MIMNTAYVIGTSILSPVHINLSILDGFFDSRNITRLTIFPELFILQKVQTT